MPIHDDLGTRMKNNYETISKTRLTRRTPVVIRIDGRAFHTFTTGFKSPFDHVLMSSMQETMKYLCENIQGCVLGYTQSDEISLLLIDYKRLNSDAWFDNEVQKVCSVSASMATMKFNKVFKENIMKYTLQSDIKLEAPYRTTLNKAIRKGAMFDSRCFNIPKDEVTNYFYWRQLDATRNSIQMVGQAYFSFRELQHKSCNDIQEMLHERKGINWNDFTVPEKRGTCCVKQVYTIDENGNETSTSLEQEESKGMLEFHKDMKLQNDKRYRRTRWVIDENIPMFKGNDRDYIEFLLLPDE